MIDDAVSESQLPRLGERANDVGSVRPYRLALGASRAFALRAIEVPSDLGVGDGREIDVRYSLHRSPRKLFRCRHHCLLRILYRTTCAVFPHEHRKIALAGAAIGSGLMRQKVCEVEELCLVQGINHIRHRRIVAATRVALVISERLREIVLALAGEARDVLAAGVITAVAKIAT